MTSKEIEVRIEELADEYCVSEDVVWMLYDMMPNELYDGIENALEDFAA